MTPQTLGKALVGFGLLLLAIGIVLMVFGKLPYLGKLPGDLTIRRDHVTIYLPITSCVVISLILSVLSRFIGKS